MVFLGGGARGGGGGTSGPPRLVRPVAGGDAVDAGYGLAGLDAEGGVGLEAGASGVLGLQGADLLDLDDPLQVVLGVGVVGGDAEQAVLGEAAGEDAGGGAAGLGREGAAGDGFGGGNGGA